jgi:hypothetical protein
MKSRTWSTAVLVLAIGALPGGKAGAIGWGYPGGFGGWGWGGWGASTAEGDMAMGLGMFAMGLGEYNKSTAIADSINAETVMHFNEYLYQSQRHVNQVRAQRDARARERTKEAGDANRDRVRNDPEPRDIFQGDALNVVLDDLNDPRIYSRTLSGSGAKLGAEAIRSINFQYASAAIVMGVHQLASGQLPAPLRAPEFEADRAALKKLDDQINKKLQDDEPIDPATVRELLATINAAEEKAAATLPPNSIQSKQAERYLKALHGLIVMLKTPSIDSVLEDLDGRPNATLGQLLGFMRAFNLRFGPATTPAQRATYTALFSKLSKLREEAAPALAAAAAPEAPATAAEDFFSSMTFDELRKKGPKP